MRTLLSLWVVLVLTTFSPANEVVVPVRVSASSNTPVPEDPKLWHVDTLRLGAARFDARTGSNGSFGLIG